MHKLSKKAIEQLYNQPSALTINGNQPFDVPAIGSLGLLATGHVGLIAWRKKRGVTGLQLFKLEGKPDETTG